MSQVIDAYYTITASSEFRERERLYAKARHDEAQALHNAERKGEARGKAEGKAEGQTEERFAIARNLLALNLPHDQITTATGLTHDEIERLK